MLTVEVNSPEELSRVLNQYFGVAPWMADFNFTKLLLEKYPMEVGPADRLGSHGWYAAPSTPGEVEDREWYVKAATLEWAICAGALIIAHRVKAVYTGEPPAVEVPKAV